MLSLSPSVALHRRRVPRRPRRPRPGKRPVFARDPFFSNPAAVEADYRRFANAPDRESATPGIRRAQ